MGGHSLSRKKTRCAGRTMIGACGHCGSENAFAPPLTVESHPSEPTVTLKMHLIPPIWAGDIA